MKYKTKKAILALIAASTVAVNTIPNPYIIRGNDILDTSTKIECNEKQLEVKKPKCKK